MSCGWFIVSFIMNDNTVIIIILCLLCICWQAEGYEFEFPELFKEKVTDEEQTARDYKKGVEEHQQMLQKQWRVQDLPPWFQWNWNLLLYRLKYWFCVAVIYQVHLAVYFNIACMYYCKTHIFRMPFILWSWRHGKNNGLQIFEIECYF